MAMATITIEAPEEAWASFVCAVHGDSGGKPEDKEARDIAATAHLKLYMKSVSQRHAEQQQIKIAEAKVLSEVKVIADELAESTTVTVSYNG